MKTNDSRSARQQQWERVIQHLCAIDNTLTLFKRTCDDMIQQNGEVYDELVRPPK